MENNMKSKDKCYANSTNDGVCCSMLCDNTIRFEEWDYRSGGVILNPNNYNNAKEYLDSFDSRLSFYKKTNSVYYNNIIKMLKRNGFQYEQWKDFIIVSNDYIWGKRKKMTIKEIEKELGYKIEIVKG